MKTHYITTTITNLGLLAILVLMFTSCNQEIGNPSQFDLKKAKSEIESRLKDFDKAVLTRDKELFASLYAEDAEALHHKGASTIGNENIAEILDDWKRNSIITGYSKTTGLWGNENLLVHQGTSYVAHSEGNWKITGTFLLVWKKVDGQWKIFKDSWFQDPVEKN